MSIIYAKINQREGISYRKMLETDKTVFSEFDPNAVESVPYSPETILDEEWFYIDKFRNKPYCIDLLKRAFGSADFDSLGRRDMEKIEYLFVDTPHQIFFQNITKAKLVSRKSIFYMGDVFEYKPDCAEITIKELPDAVYVKDKDKLYLGS